MSWRHKISLACFFSNASLTWPFSHFLCFSQQSKASLSTRSDSSLSWRAFSSWQLFMLCPFLCSSLSLSQGPFLEGCIYRLVLCWLSQINCNIHSSLDCCHNPRNGHLGDLCSHHASCVNDYPARVLCWIHRQKWPEELWRYAPTKV